jgi:hypothetical protein
MNLLRWDFSLNAPIVGVTLTSGRGGESVQVQSRGFYTSDDGPQLYTVLDSFYDFVLGHGVPLRPEQIARAFVSVADGTEVTALINPPLQLSIVAKGEVKAGHAVYREQIVDTSEARIPGYEFPSRGAIAYLFQDGWRRGFYFDFSAHVPDAPKDKPLGDVASLLGSLHTALMLRDRIRMDPTVLRRMAAEGWFPFTRLSTASVLTLYRHFENEWEPTEPEAKIVGEVGPQIARIVEEWASKPAFVPHMDVLRTGARLFGEGEVLAASCTVLPKVEGVLRHVYAGTQNRPNAPELRNDLVGRVRAAVEGYTALLPESFIQYLEVYYYAGFDLRAGVVPPSRHAFLHGVGPDEHLKDPSYCLRLFLTLDQVFFCLSRMKEPT